MEKNDFLILKPMLLNEIEEPFNSKDYIYELKFDGIRSLIFVDKNEIIIKSRNGVILNDIFSELNNIKNITNEVCIFDGEIVILDNGKPSFKKVMQRFRLKNKYKIERIKEENPVTFVCFDILYKNQDLTNLSLFERKKILNKYKDNDIFIKVKYIQERGIDLFNSVKRSDLEGVVAKRKDSKYYYGNRTSDWVKIKNWKCEDFYVCGYEFNKTNSTISVILGEKINDSFNYVGKVIIGEKNSIYKKIIDSKKVKKYLEGYKGINAFYIEPKIKIPINYIERTSDNMLREAFFKK